MWLKFGEILFKKDENKLGYDFDWKIQGILEIER